MAYTSNAAFECERLKLRSRLGGWAAVTWEEDFAP
jgi:hypothetical protein